MAFKNPLVSTLAIQAPRNFAGSLNANEVFSGLYNMIIGQVVLNEDASTGYDDVVAKFRTEGGLYGDTKLFLDADSLGSYDWEGDNDLNVLATHRPADPKCQSVIVNIFRQIALTVDEYLTKRGFSSPTAFGDIQSLLIKRIGEAKRDHEAKLLNVFVGTATASSTINTVTVTFESGATNKADIEAQNRINAQKVATALANLTDEMKDSSCDYNEYGFYRSYKPEDLVVVYNAKYVNDIRIQDIPTIFHKDAVDPVVMHRLPAKYFGDVITAFTSYESSTETKAKPINSSTHVYKRFSDADRVIIRSKYERNVTIGGVVKKVHSGDELPDGCICNSANADFLPADVYIENANIVCKVLHKNSIPFMSAFETSTEFWNAKAINTNKYLTWGYSEVTYLKGLPLIKVVKN